MGSRSKKKKVLQIRWRRPELEPLESRIAPAVLTYAAPTGQPFQATLQLDTTGNNIELVNGSTVLASQLLSNTTGVAIYGPNQVSALTVDLNTTLSPALPITFDSGTASSPGATAPGDVLNVVSNGSLSATYAPGLTSLSGARTCFEPAAPTGHAKARGGWEWSQRWRQRTTGAGAAGASLKKRHIHLTHAGTRIS